MSTPGFWLPQPQDVVKVDQTVQGVEKGAAAALGGAVHDVLGMPQAMINVFYNFGGFILGNALVFLGLFLLTLHLFGDVLKDAAHDVSSAIDPDSKKTPAVETVVGKVIETGSALL